MTNASPLLCRDTALTSDTHVHPSLTAIFHVDLSHGLPSNCVVPMPFQMSITHSCFLHQQTDSWGTGHDSLYIKHTKWNSTSQHLTKQSQLCITTNALYMTKYLA